MLVLTSAPAEAASPVRFDDLYSSAAMGVLSLSPDGAWLIAADRPPHRPEGVIGRPPTVTYRLLDTACLKRKAALDRCTRVRTQLPHRPRIVWREDGAAVLVIAGAKTSVRFFQRGGVWVAAPAPYRDGEQTNWLPGILAGPLFDAWPDDSSIEPAGDVWKEVPAEFKAKLEAVDGDALGPAVPIYGSDGRVMGWNAFDKSGVEVSFNRRASASFEAGFLRERSLLPLENWPWLVIRLHRDGEGFYVRSGDLGPKPGILRRYRPGVVADLPLPPDPDSPLQAVFTPSFSQAVGVFSLDRFHAVEASAAFGEAVDRYVADQRRATPDLELMQIVTNESLDVVVLRFRRVTGYDQLHILDPGTGAGRRIVVENQRGLAAPRVTSAPIIIPVGETTLPARLYTADRVVPPKGVVISLHGGPSVNILSNSHRKTRWFLSLGYDVLQVDYRGSTGYGAAHLEALGPPLPPVVQEDLNAAVAWVRAQPAYADRRVGLEGTSFGGLYGVVALRGGGPHIDFMMLDSPFIDDHGRITGPCAEFSPFWTKLFGRVTLPDGQCTAASTGMLDVAALRPIPVFIYSGDRDTQTPTALTRRWFDLAGDRGACLMLIQAVSGRHGMSGLPDAVHDPIAADFTRWLGEIEAGRITADCGRRIVRDTKGKVTLDERSAR
ncbi:MAG: prolyl oligopeptidase family serine peptidase [Caulobacter sp.]|nr:prolyl oligopeptidase family serine peptidase [Caulobacter sp.]